MSSEQHLDYHVGLLRGFVLAHNAPTQILHALDVPLKNYRSKAGYAIGSQSKEEPQAVKMPSQPKMPPVEYPIIPEITTSEKKMVFWNAADDKALIELYVNQGFGPKIIAGMLNRTPASISARIQNKGLKRHEEGKI